MPSVRVVHVGILLPFGLRAHVDRYVPRVLDLLGVVLSGLSSKPSQQSKIVV